MKASNSTPVKYNLPAILFFLLILVSVFSAKHAYSQIDYTFGRNTSGIRIGVGIGAAQLDTHFNSNPYQAVYIGSLDYDVNPYLSAGLEAQYGTLQGIDDIHHLYYYSSTDNYLSGTFNMRFAVGLINDYDTYRAIDDVIKRIYIGIGVGAIKTDNKFVVNSDTRSTIYGNPVPEGKYLLIPLNIGTNIDLINTLGWDRLSLNPNFQLNYVNSLFLDGFQSTQQSSLKGFYHFVSLKIKYKF